MEVYFSTGDGSDCAEVQAFTRNIPDDVQHIGAAFDQLVTGPTDEETDAGAGSSFTADASSVITSVTVTDALLIVDFVDLRPLLPNASTSCGSEALRRRRKPPAQRLLHPQRQ